MSFLFFGDSITAGSSSPISFTDCIKEEVLNFGISGTTIGEYSIYPVDGYSLLSMYDKVSGIKTADKIFLEYGINDVSSIMCDFTELQKVIVSFVKALDGITQLNKTADIYFLSISDVDNIIQKYAKLQCDYLSDDYFKGFNFSFPVSKWAGLYISFISAVKTRLKVIPMIENVEFLYKYISSDNIHPNAAGHKLIAENIKKYI